MENHQTLLSQVGISLDIELSFDENGQCFLLLDEHLMVSIRSLEGGWMLYGMLGNMETHEDREQVARLLLTLNLQLAQSGGGSIALEASSDVIMLVQYIDTTATDAKRLEETLGRFVGTLSNTIDVLNGEMDFEDQPSAPAFPEPGSFDRA